MSQNPTTSSTNFLDRLTPWTNWRRKRFWVLVAFMVYSLLGFFAMPPLVRWLAISNIEKTGRTALLGEVRVNPYTLTILTRNAEVHDSDGVVILAYDEVFLNFQTSSLFRWAWTFEEIRLSGLYLHEERFGEFDTRYTRLAEAFVSPEQAEPSPEEGGLPRMVIGRFSLLDGSVAYTDRTAGDFEGKFGPINVEVEDLRTLPDHSGAHAVSIKTANGGHIEWRGSLQAVPLASAGQLSIRGRGLDDAFRYAAHFLPFDVMGDGVSIDLDYQLGLRDGAPYLSIDNLQSDLQGGRIRIKGADENVLATRSITAAGGTLRWPQATARLESVVIEGLELSAGLLPDGTLDLAALIPESGTTPNQAESGPSEAESVPVLVEIGAFRIPGARIHLTDATMQPPVKLDLDPLELEITGIDNREGTSMPVRLAANLSTGGMIRYQGEAAALPEPGTRGRLDAESLALSLAQPYVEPHFRIALKDGRLDLSADLEHGPGQPAHLAGRIGLHDLLVNDTKQAEKLLAWDTLLLDRFELDLAANTLETSVLEFEGLFGRLHIDENLETNVAGLVVEQAPAAGQEPGSLPSLQIGGIELRDAALDFSDFSLPLPFRTNIRKLNGDISTLSTTSTEPSRLALEGQVNEFGQARINGEINPWSPTDLAHVDMTFRNLDLSRLTPYTIQFAGYAIDSGRLELDLGYRLDQRRLNGQNRVVIREIQLGEKVDHPDAGSLPLGLAVALLSDAEGVIDLEVPVEGDLDDPQFRIGGLVWKALGNLIAKAVTAPFRLLGKLVGMDSENFGTLQFAAGRSDISPPDLEQLLKLGEAMLQRPELTVEVGGVYAPGPDREALAAMAVEQLADQRLAELDFGPEVLSIERERRVLESLAGQQLPGLDLAALLAEHSLPPVEGAKPAPDVLAYLSDLRTRLESAQAIGEAELAALAEARAEAVLGALRAGQPDTELRIAAGEIKAVETDDPLAIPLELGVKAGD